jgi:hypothetical protein
VKVEWWLIEAAELWGTGMGKGCSVGTKTELDGKLHSRVLKHSRVITKNDNILYNFTDPKKGF